ncbi:T7SS effector LXG polymorphic toxin [Leifsonia xyli]|uniref:T7SS effector LXG polymorphic toxin n=1 Tax=Leifsonia xyli TaxID=1575 RepID=UPI003D677FC7
MGVVEFSADAWQASSPGLRGGLARRMEAVSELAQGLQALAGSERISGQGADAMRAYIREVHGPILQSLLIGLSTFQTAIGVYWNGYAQVDASGNFRLVRDELEAHLSQLESGMGALRGIAAELRKISGDASHVVSLGGAGATAAERCVDDLDRMHAIAKGQLEAWEAFEASDHGFGQVKALIAELNRIVANVGAVTVGQGRTYTPGSFQLTLQGLGALTSGMVEYCQQNQGAASKGWESAFTGFQKDLEAAEKARREQAGWDLIWDGLQIVAGAVVTAIGLGLTPFTGGVSIGLTVLGGTLLVGGINNAVNHASIATTGQEFNLMDMAATWVDVNLAQPIAAFGPVGQFVGGVVSGTGHVLTGFGQLSVKDAAVGVSVLVTDQAARDALWDQLAATGAQIAAGNWYVAGQTTAEVAALVIPGIGAVRAIRAATVGKSAAEAAAEAGQATSPVGQAGRPLGKVVSSAKSNEVREESFGGVPQSLKELFSGGRTPKSSELRRFSEEQGWTLRQNPNGPPKYIDENGIPRVTIKSGSDRAEGSGFPHVEYKDASGQRFDPVTGNAVARKDPLGNHREIDIDE